MRRPRPTYPPTLKCREKFSCPGGFDYGLAMSGFPGNPVRNGMRRRSLSTPPGPPLSSVPNVIVRQAIPRSSSSHQAADLRPNSWSSPGFWWHKTG